MPDNTVTIIGNLTREPELRFTNSGQAQATMGVAVNRRWQNRQSGEWEEQTSFLNVVAWRDLAENVAHSLPKGCRVIVTGRLEQRSWETQDGEKRSVIEVVADEIAPSLRWATASVERNERKGAGEFGGGGGGGGGGGRGGGSRPPANEDTGSGGGGRGFADDEEPF
jgi:single-strand DNA-binding protein